MRLREKHRIEKELQSVFKKNRKKTKAEINSKIIVINQNGVKTEILKD